MSAFRGVVLIGFMGAGKSHVGRCLGARLGWPFTDTDAVIAERHGAISEVFARQGEKAFREIEAEVVLATLARGPDRGVVALGGGALTEARVRAALTRCEHVIWLSAAAETLYARVSHSRESAARAPGSERPLASDRESFLRLYDERLAVYEQAATMTLVNDGGRTVADLVDELVAAVGVMGGGL